MATFGCPPVSSICSIGIVVSYVQTVQTDSALTTSFGRHDFIGVITDDSVPCSPKNPQSHGSDRPRAMPASGRCRLPRGRELIFSFGQLA